jgi:hypothetical protein
VAGKSPNLMEVLMGNSSGDGSKPLYLVNIKIAGKWMFIPLKMVSIGIDPYPSINAGLSITTFDCWNRS